MHILLKYFIIVFVSTVLSRGMADHYSGRNWQVSGVVIVCACAPACLYAHVGACMHACMQVYMFECVCMRECVLCARTYVCMHVDVCISIHMCTCHVYKRML